ncbi:MAG: CbiX/SirB N-terminal domain-containing protein [Candidatus Thorarchaeota archaeon]
MRGKKIILISTLIVSILVIGQINNVLGITLVADQTNDVYIFEDGIRQKKGDYHNEIDIRGITFVGIWVVLYLDGAPIINDNKHIYTVEIYWSQTGTAINSTIITVGGDALNAYQDSITYNLVDTTGVPIERHPMIIENSTEVHSTYLQWEMNIEYLMDPAHPFKVNTTATYYSIETEGLQWYEDTASSDTEPPIFSTQNLLPLIGTLVVCAFAGYTLGSILVYYLTTNIRSKEKNAIFMGVTTLALAVVVHWLFWVTPWQILWDTVIYLIATVFGFIWANRGIMKLQFEQPLPEGLPIETDEEKNEVIVLAKGEPEEYSPLPLIRNYNEFAAAGIPQKHKYLQPFEFFRMKNKYRQLLKLDSSLTGKNPYRSTVKEVINKLEESFLDMDGYSEAYVNDWPTINQTILRAISTGAKNITILPLFISDGYEYQLALKEFKKIDFSDSGVTIKQAEFLGNSEKIQDYLVERIVKSISDGKDKSSIGILLIADGQPTEFDSKYTLIDDQNSFRDTLRKKLSKKGFSENLIEYAWIHDRDPTIKQAFANLCDAKCTTIITVATTTPIKCIDSEVEINTLVQKLASQKNIEVKNIGAWNAEKEIITAYLASITSAKELPLKELGKDAKIVMQNTQYGAQLAKSATTTSDEVTTDKNETKSE